MKCVERRTVNKDNPRAGSEIIDRVHVVAEQCIITYNSPCEKKKQWLTHYINTFFCVSPIERSHFIMFLVSKSLAYVFNINKQDTLNKHQLDASHCTIALTIKETSMHQNSSTILP